MWDVVLVSYVCFRVKRNRPRIPGNGQWNMFSLVHSGTFFSHPKHLLKTRVSYKLPIYQIYIKCLKDVKINEEKDFLFFVLNSTELIGFCFAARLRIFQQMWKFKLKLCNILVVCL